MTLLPRSREAASASGGGLHSSTILVNLSRFVSETLKPSTSVITQKRAYGKPDMWTSVSPWLQARCQIKSGLVEDALACLTTVESLESPTAPATLLVKLEAGRRRMTPS